MNFSDTFKHYRKMSGYTQEQIADILMVTPQAVSKWEVGASVPDFSLIVPIARLFNISTDLLLGNINDCRDDIVSALTEISPSRNNYTYEEYESVYAKHLEMLRQNPESKEALSGTLNMIAMWLSKYAAKMSEDVRLDILNNAEHIAKRLAKFADGSYAAHCLMCDIYSYADEPEKERQQLEYLSKDGRYTQNRTAAVHQMIKRKNSKAVLSFQQSLYNDLVWLFFDIERLAAVEYVENADDNNSKEIYKAEYDLLKALSCPVELKSYFVSACTHLAVKSVDNKDEMYKYLDEMMDALQNINDEDNASVLFDRIETDYTYKRVSKKGLLNRLKLYKSFEPVRSEERFKAYINEIERLDDFI